MPRLTIHQFRAALASRSEQSVLVRAYRELARRPEAVASRSFADWPLWDAGAPLPNA